ncbi:MAG: DUF429 domain-containing protein [Chloroflexota bacterium]|nr:DUF429 domain-containing protein [Chloroflexota bacterium]
MPAVLGIDAAWTATEPTGVALIRGEGSDWRCVALAPSYDAFVALASGKSVDWQMTAGGAAPEPGTMLAAAERLLGDERVAVAAVDMPLATLPITARRAADGAVSRAFSGRGCGTHSPSPERPGSISTRLAEGFAARGYPLATAATPPGTAPRLVEVYPHPALRCSGRATASRTR